MRKLYFVCPRLLELDARHGEHNCGQKYPELEDPEGHLTNLHLVFDEEAAIEFPTCPCGKQLALGEEPE